MEERIIEIFTHLTTTIKNLSSTIEDLNDNVSTTDYRLKKIEDTLEIVLKELNQRNNKPIVSNNSTIQTIEDKPEKVNKNYTVLEEFLQVVPDKSKDFVSSIVNNNYPTMTLKQFDALDRLAKQIGFTGNLAQ